MSTVEYSIHGEIDVDQIDSPTWFSGATGFCAVCGRYVGLTKATTLVQHGPRQGPCAGSGLSPRRAVSAALMAAKQKLIRCRTETWLSEEVCRWEHDELAKLDAACPSRYAEDEKKLALLDKELS